MAEGTQRGALTEAVYYILLALYRGPRHGYGIMQDIERLSGGRLTLGPGTLYGALNTLLQKGWICAQGGEISKRKKVYAVTAWGKSVLAEEIARLEELLQNGRRITGEEKP